MQCSGSLTFVSGGLPQSTSTLRTEDRLVLAITSITSITTISNDSISIGRSYYHSTSTTTTTTFYYLLLIASYVLRTSYILAIIYDEDRRDDRR